MQKERKTEREEITEKICFLLGLVVARHVAKWIPVDAPFSIDGLNWCAAH